MAPSALVIVGIVPNTPISPVVWVIVCIVANRTDPLPFVELIRDWFFAYDATAI